MYVVLTLWCLKQVASEMQHSPICSNTLKIFEGEPPESNVPNDNKKFPAGMLVSVMLGWLFQTFSLFLHASLLHVVVTFAMVPYF
jgi:hypothetical protein